MEDKEREMEGEKREKRIQRGWKEKIYVLQMCESKKTDRQS